MLSVEFTRFGAPAEVLALQERAQPVPAAGQVIVRLRARPIHPSDLLMVQGVYGELPTLPATPGGEAVGVIDAIGPGVSGYRLGQRVSTLASASTAGSAGTWQEYLCTTPERLIPVPDEVSDVAAAQAIINPFTAWLMTTEELKLEPGQWLLQTAASSTVGRLVVQIAKLRGFKTINVVRRRAHIDALKALGADEVICTDSEDLFARVMALTGNAGVPAAIDAVGGHTGTAAAQALGRHGVMLSYGLLSTEPISVNGLGLMIFRCATLRGFWLVDWLRNAPLQRYRTVSLEVMKLLANGRITLPVEAEYPLRQVAQAAGHAQRPGKKGTVLLTS